MRWTLNQTRRCISPLPVYMVGTTPSCASSIHPACSRARYSHYHPRSSYIPSLPPWYYLDQLHKVRSSTSPSIVNPSPVSPVNRGCGDGGKCPTQIPESSSAYSRRPKREIRKFAISSNTQPISTFSFVVRHSLFTAASRRFAIRDLAAPRWSPNILRAACARESADTPHENSVTLDLPEDETQTKDEMYRDCL